MILLLIGDALGENEIGFAKLAIRFEVPFAFIRSKCDKDLQQNALDLYDKPFNELSEDKRFKIKDDFIRAGSCFAVNRHRR